MALELDFVISDESINRYGFRILTAGILLHSFEQNPVCCIGHNTEGLSIGKWKNLRKEADGRLLGMLEFDEDDTDAVRLYNKYKNGYMKAVSLNVRKISESAEPAHILPGQERPTVLESELLEISLVTLPGNGNAVKLFNAAGEEVQLSFIENPLNNNNMAKTVEELQRENDTLRQQRATDMVRLHLERGAMQAGEQAFYEKAAMTDFDGTSTVLALRPGKVQTDNTAEQLAEMLISLHFERGAITEPERVFFKKSAVVDYEGTKTVLSARPGKEVVDNFMAGMSKPSADKPDEERSKWTYLDYYKNDREALTQMQKTAPEKHKQILDAYKLSLSKSSKYIMDDDND